MIQRTLAANAFLAISLLAGCGGGGGSPTPPVVTPPLAEFAIVSSRPADVAGEAPRSGGFVATFSAAPDPASINATSLQLLGPQGNAIPGVVTVKGKDVSFLPDVPALPGGTKYTANFLPSIKDVGARSLNAPYSRSFTTAPQAWGAVSRQVAEMPYLTSGVTPVVAIDKSGNATAVWRHQVSGIATAFASRMDHGTGNWSVPVVIHAATGIFGDIGGFSISADGNGNAYVVWTEYDNGKQSILMARYVSAKSAWNQPIAINGLPTGLVPSDAVIAIDGNGVLTVVMRSNFMDGVYGTRFDPAADTWSIPVEIEKPAVDNYIFNLQLVADSAGNATLGWVQRGTVNNGFNVARYSAANGNWSAPHTLDVNVTSGPFALAADVAGGATVAWTHGNQVMDTPSIVASRFDVGAITWSKPARLSGDGDAFGASAPAVAVDAAGIATVVWAQSRGIVEARSGRSTATWSTARRIGTAAPDLGQFAVTTDLAGNVLLLYVADGTTMAMHYSATSALWMAPAAIGTPDGGQNVFANSPVSVIDVAGNVTAVWLAQISVAGTPRYVVAANRFH